MSYYSSVKQRHDSLIICAGGPSGKLLKDYRPLVPVIAVNAAITWLRFVDYWFTLDPSPENMAILRYRRRDVVHFAAVPPEFQTEAEGVTYLRRIAYAPTAQDHAEATMLGDWGLRWSAVRGLSREPTCIHTGNSAYGALGLAYLMGAKRIVLCGVDGTTEQRVDGGFCRNSIEHLPVLFGSAAQQLKDDGVEVVTASLGSKVDCFPRMTFEEAMQWISR